MVQNKMFSIPHEKYSKKARQMIIEILTYDSDTYECFDDEEIE
jgi:hypothetical protein